MKKIITLLVTILSIISILAFTACSSSAKYVALQCEDAEEEFYGFCIKKDAENHDAIINAINKVVKSLDMLTVVNYYTALSKDETPETTLDQPDLSDNTGDTLDVCTCSGFEPFEFIVDEEVVGVDMYVMALVCEELNMKMNIIDMDFDGIVGKVKTSENTVGAAGISITDERKDSVDFADSYYHAVQCIISTDSQNYTKLEQLKGKKIGVQKGTTGNFLVADAIDSGVLKDTGAEIVEYDTGAVAYTALKAGKIDYIVLDELPAQKLVG